MRRIVIVGASLAGLRAAQVLRAEGFDGTLTMAGAEPHPPYDRPPLSKGLLASDSPPDTADLPLSGELGIDLVLGQPAVRLAPRQRYVRLADGRRLPYDGLVIATGASARPWPGGPRPLPSGVFTLRSRDDALALRAEMRPGRRLVVAGGGFLGGEVAAAARARGLDVTLVAAQQQPLARTIGTAAGAYLAALHRQAGIDVRTHRGITTLEGAAHLTGVRLSDGTLLRADLMVVALGAVPNSGWLKGSGLRSARGVECDRYLRALREDGSPAPDIVASGDVVRWPHPLVGGRQISLGHWSNAVEQAEAAARTLLDPADPQPFGVVPSFWSDLHGVQLRAVGLPALADESRVLLTDPEHRELEVTYRRGGRLIGALTVNRTRQLAAHRRHLQDQLSAVAR